MMQLDQLILFNGDGETRTIDFRAGRLNIITGDSRTGKSSLIGIIRFLLGSASPNVPFGTIQESVAWYGLHAHVGETRFFIARAAPAGRPRQQRRHALVDPVATPRVRRARAQQLACGRQGLPRRAARSRGQPQRAGVRADPPSAVGVVQALAVLLLPGAGRDRQPRDPVPPPEPRMARAGDPRHAALLSRRPRRPTTSAGAKSSPNGGASYGGCSSVCAPPKPSARPDWTGPARC